MGEREGRRGEGGFPDLFIRNGLHNVTSLVDPLLGADNLHDIARIFRTRNGDLKKKKSGINMSSPHFQ